MVTAIDLVAAIDWMLRFDNGQRGIRREAENHGYGDCVENAKDGREMFHDDGSVKKDGATFVAPLVTDRFAC